MTRGLLVVVVFASCATPVRPAARATRELATIGALDYRAPIDPTARSRDHAAARLLAACRAGDRTSCWRGLAIADGRPLADAFAIATGRNCLASDEPSCRALATDLRLQLHDSPALCSSGLAAACFATASHRDRRSFLQRGCDLGDAASCFALWSHDRDRSPAVVEFRRARALERAIAECVRGFPHSCSRISQLDPEAAPRWLPQLRIEAGTGCSLGLLDECALLTRFAANPRLEAFAATQLCTTRGTHCELLVALHQPAGSLPDPLALRDALEHHCQLGRDRASCSRLAAAYLSNQFPEPIRGRGKQLASFLATAPRSTRL
jgi:hypothetical protein